MVSLPGLAIYTSGWKDLGTELLQMDWVKMSGETGYRPLLAG